MKWIISERINLLSIEILIISFIFFIPISITFKSIFLVFSVLALLGLPLYRPYLLLTYKTLVGILSLALFLYIMLSCLWSPAPWSMQWASLSKYLKLLYLPILAIAFIHPKLRYRAINTYLFAMMITCIISILKAQGLLVSTDAGSIIFNHIVTGLMMAFASYLAGMYAFQAKGYSRGIYIIILLLTSYQILFINIGRTGYLAYVILMGLLFVQHLNWKKACLAFLFFCGILGIVYTQSQYLQIRVQESINEVQNFNKNKNTSIGYRLQFHDYAKALFLEHPFLGLGTGGFKYRFIQDNPVPSWGTDIADPHSQYWMTLSEQGLFGLILLGSFLGGLLITSFRIKETKPILWGILAVFLIGSISDTLFCFSPIGYLLITMSALCLGELIQIRKLPGSN